MSSVCMDAMEASPTGSPEFDGVRVRRSFNWQQPPPSWWSAVNVIVHSLASKHSSRTAVLKAIKLLVPTLTVGNANAGFLTLRHSSR